MKGIEEVTFRIGPTLIEHSIPSVLIITHPNNTLTVTGLKPNTNYTASVRAVFPQLDMFCMEQGVAYSQHSDNGRRQDGSIILSHVRFLDPEFVSTNLETLMESLW